MKFLGWMLGLSFAATGVLMLPTTIMGGLLLIAASALTIPLAIRLLSERANFKTTLGSRAVAVSVLLACFVEVMSNKEQADRAAYFLTNKESVMASLSHQVDEKNYIGAIDGAKKYLSSKDPDLLNLYETAIETKEAQDNAQETAKLVAELKWLPASAVRKNRDLYQRLVELNPGDTMFKSKLEHYEKKYAERVARETDERNRIELEQRALAAKFGEKPQQVVEGRPYWQVEYYLKEVANDPDSIEVDRCTKVYQSERGWLVGCDYRGRNAFGGMIRKSNWFTISHDRVVQIDETSAFNPRN